MLPPPASNSGFREKDEQVASSHFTELICVWPPRSNGYPSPPSVMVAGTIPLLNPAMLLEVELEHVALLQVVT